MKAVRIHAFGGGDVIALDDIARPAPEANDVIVRVSASGVNPMEWKVRSGMMGSALGRPLPATLGWECSGVVVETGPGVVRFKTGDEVFALTPFTREGTHAEYVAVDADAVAIKPSSLSFVQAAAVPMTAQAAWSALEGAALISGQRLLIQGAGGAVGHWLIQFAKEAGLHVTGTASTDDLSSIRALGCEGVVDYRHDKFEDAGMFDAVIDLVGGETQERSWAVINPGGRLVSLAMPPAPERAGVKGVFVFTQSRGWVLGKIAAMIDAGTLVALPVANVLPLADAARAHAMGETGKGGKTVLTVAAT